uniref:Putative treble-clef zinc-finger domain-containing protein n=1 Tax=Sipha flava TaxID=143950 RepID=A0A2S2PZ00_9HEMI
MAHTNKIKALLSDLGRSTKRGVKKCPSCGTYNGTRTVVCKNCDLLLKPNNKRVSPSEVCSLLTSSSSRIFSYIMSENIDFNERGFVHFPGAKNKEINKLDTGICLVHSCGRSFDSNVLKCHESVLNTSIQSEPCKHVRSCFDCNTIGVSLKIDQQVLESFRVPQTVKQEVWSNFIDKKKPYLQRVSENIFVVRCKITTQNPLGYLHCIIGKYNRCFCCTTTLVTVDQMDQIPDLNTYFCCHYIACLSAIASSRYMVQDFEKNLNPFVSISTLSATIVQLDNLQSNKIFL